MEPRPLGQRDRFTAWPAHAAVDGRGAGAETRHVRRYVEFPQSRGLRDPETGAFDLPFFMEYAERELVRAQRYGRPVGLVRMEVGGTNEMAGIHGREAIGNLLRASRAAVGRVARDVDLIARTGANEFSVLLPETDRFGAMTFQRRILAVAAADPTLAALTRSLPFSLEVGAATHPRDGRELEGLLAKARERARQGRRSIARSLGSLGFWDSVSALLEDEALAPDDGESALPASRRLRLTPLGLQAIRAEVMREVAREAGGRGLLFASAGSGVIDASLPMLEALSPGGTSWSIYLLGKRGPSTLVHPVVSPVYVDAQDPIGRHDLLLLLSEESAYALLRREDGSAFHTSDGPLVDHLLTRLQQAYDLHTD